MRMKIPHERQDVIEMHSVLSRMKSYTHDFKLPLKTSIKMSGFDKDRQRRAMERLDADGLIVFERRPIKKSGQYEFSIPNNAKLMHYSLQIDEEYGRAKNDDSYKPRQSETGIFWDEGNGVIDIDGTNRATLTIGKHPRQLMEYIWSKRSQKVISLDEVIRRFNWNPAQVRRAFYAIEDTSKFERGELFKFHSKQKAWELSSMYFST
ncbi:hypothetical protein EPN81_02105 [Patescibacteria group bacterium]|nr:MAG: hypothetical protein EPN81_02105 [Patescibacteria group bacterium]